VTRVYKLVRDKIPHMLDEETRARNPVFHKLEKFTPDFREQILVGKLQEELEELREAYASQDMEKVAEECADLYEVLHTMTQYLKIPPGYVSGIRSVKNHKRGDFSSHLVMEWDADE
jgi:predicted house-cleaning noncanonical NTP pyrophosphatase (MazG superfamily)